MTATELLADLDRRGVRLEARGDRLRYAPRSALTPELVERLRSHKTELLAVLSDAGAGSSQFPAPVDDLADDWAVGIPWPVQSRAVPDERKDRSTSTDPPDIPGR